MRKNIVAGNWKMNLNYQDAKGLVAEIKSSLTNSSKSEIFIIPPFVYASELAGLLKESPLRLGVQNCSMYKGGAYTGEVSASMLQSIGAKAALVGHSERRQYFKESNHQLAEKINRLLEHDLTPVYCIGESLAERKSDSYKEVLEEQLVQALFHLSAEKFSNIVIAYEPIWAIGTGETASPEQAQEVHAFIRGIITEQYDEQTANNLSILYGGSVKPSNAKELFAMPDIDGGLIGGASLNASDFVSICNAF